MFRNIKSLKYLIAVVFVAVLLSMSLIAQSGGSSDNQSRETNNKVDKNLKSLAHINPSTLAMEMTIPLAGYPGRNGNSLPVSMSYTSKLWRMDNISTYWYPKPYSGARQYVTWLMPRFAEKSAAGWTSSIKFPVIEERLVTYNQMGDINDISYDLDNFNYIYSSSNESSLNAEECSYPDPYECFILGGACNPTYCPTSCSFCTSGGGGIDGGGGGEISPPEKTNYVKRVQVRIGESSHEFRKSDAVFGYCGGGTNDGENCEGTNPGYFDNEGMFLAVDGSGMKLKRDHASGSILYMPDGSHYLFPATSTDGDGESTLYQATDYFDASGNHSSFSNVVAQPRSITDTLGRKINDFLPQNFENQEQTEGIKQINLPSLNGRLPQHYELKWLHLKPVPNGIQEGALEHQEENLFYYGSFICRGSPEPTLYNNAPGNSIPSDIMFPYSGIGLHSCNPGASVQTAERFNPVVLSEILIPNNKTYTFNYNQFGEIMKIIYPSGEIETFKHAKIEPMSGYSQEAYEQTNRGVIEHRVYDSNHILQQREKYSVKRSEAGSNSIYTVTTKLPKQNTDITQEPMTEGIKTERILINESSSSEIFGFGNPLTGMPKEERTYDENGVLRSRTLTEWITKGAVSTGDPLRPAYSGAQRDARVKRTVSVTIESNQALAVLSENDYDENDLVGSTNAEYFSHLNVKQSKSYQFVSIDVNTAKFGTLAQIAGYFSSAPLASISETTYLYDANYKARGIPSLPIETRVLNPNNPDPNNPLAKTQTVYDEYGAATSGALGGTLTSATGDLAATWSDQGSNLRGKPTTVKLWDDDNNAWIQTHTQYDQYGNARKVWEANEPTSSNRFVETEYSATYGAAFPTRVITPAPDPTGTHGTNLGSEATSTYDPMTGLPLTATNEFGQTTANEYNDSLLRPTRSYAVNFVAPETQTIYDDNLLTVKVRKQIDQNNWDEATTYADSLGRTVMTQAKDSQGDVFIKTEYDFLGRVKRTTSPFRSGDTLLWSSVRYDELGRAVESYASAPDGTTGASLGTTNYGISTDSGVSGTYVLTTDAAGKQKRAVTNSLGQLARVDEADSNGIVKPLETPTPNPSPNPSPTPLPTFTPDPNGCYNRSPNNPPDPCTENFNFTGNSTYSSVSTIYSYDVKGNLVEVAQGDQHRYFKYDSLSRLIRVRQPEQDVNPNLNLADTFNTSGEWTAGFVYDALGSVIRTTDANGVNTITEYDKAKRVTKRCYTKPNFTTSATACSQISSGDLSANTPAVEYFYDGKGLDQIQTPYNYAKGKLTKVTSSVSETRYVEFDYLGRLTKSEQRTPFGTETVAQATPRVSLYEYNFSGALVKQTYPSGRVVQNEFEADGDLLRVFGKANAAATEKTYANSFSYTAAGGISQMRLGNGRWETAKFNERLQLTELGLGSSATDAGVWKVNYEYGEIESNGTLNAAKNTGNIARQTLSFNGLSTPLVQTYKYDSLYRLTEAKETANGAQTWIQNFGYDRFGNRTAFAQEIGSLTNTQTLNINAAKNRIEAGQGYSYDKNGNVIQDVSDSNQVRQFIFNGENKQTEVKDANGVSIGKYYYDGEGRRVKKFLFNTQETTVFVYDGTGKLVAEYSTTPPPIPQIKYLTEDHLGTPRIITDAGGNVVARRDFMPFGEDVFVGVGARSANDKYGANEVDVRQKFTGYEKDAETDLDFAQARMFGSSLGRFTSPDPAMLSMNGNNPQSFNRYIYVMNNPLLYTDPLGLWAVEFRAVYKQKDGKDTTEIDHYIAVAVQTKGDKDTPAELARQLGLTGKEADKFVKNFADKLADGKITADGVQLSKLGGDVGRVFGMVQDLWTSQKKAEAKGKGAPNDSINEDCSSTSANLNSPFAGARGSSNWSVGRMDEYIRNNLKSIAEGDLRVGDVVRYALDEINGKGEVTNRNAPKHFTTFLFMSDSNVPMVFSRSGQGGPFQYGTASQFTGKQNDKVDYGSIRGIGKDSTGYYGRR